MNWNCVLSHGGELPKRNHATDAGLDIKAKGYQRIINNKLDDRPYWFDEQPIGDIRLDPGDRILIKTGIQLQIPSMEKDMVGYEVQVRPRSGLALKHGISMVNAPGTIDEEYRGDIGVIIINHGTESFVITDGMRIAQLVINEVSMFNFQEIEYFDSTTKRGDKGYGSSGTD